MRFSIAIFLFIVCHSVSGQILYPAKWNTEVSTNSPKPGDEIELIFNVKLDPSWYIYSTDFDPDLGPTVTSFSFEKNDSFLLIGEIKPIDSKKKYDEIWEGEYTYFKEKGKFVQLVKVLKENPTIEAECTFQVCSEIDGKCIYFEEYFDFSELLNN